MVRKKRYSSSQVMCFLIPSLIGAILFLCPISYNGSLNTALGIAIDFLKSIFKPWLPFAAMVVVVISTLVSLWATIAKPEKILQSEFWKNVLIVKPFWLISRVLGAFLYVIIYYKVGPEIIWSMDNGGTPAMLLAPTLLIVVSILGVIIPLLTDYGLMEFIGTFARPVMRPLFKLPGRSAVDCCASLVGSATVAVVITTNVHDQGYYSDREAAIITTCFSLISLPYIYIMADFVGLPNMYFQILIATYFVTLLLAFVMPRIWPLSHIQDEYSGKDGKNSLVSATEGLPGGYSRGEWALKVAIERAEKQTLRMTVFSGFKTFMSITISTMPLVISWGTIVLILANNTPIFQIMSFPFAWILQLMRIPEATEVAPAFILGFADQFLAALVGAARTATAAKFMCACISGTGLIYMTEVGVLILNSRIPLNFCKLAGIYLIRAIISAFCLAPFAWWFCM